MSLSHAPSRREALLGAGALFAWTQMPRVARAEGRDPRMLVIILRGALDGLGAVAPVGDPDWIGLRGDRALTLDGKTAALPLDGFFGLNPAMPNLHRLYKAQQATIVHATATPYRERSHFDGQDVLESGIAKPGSSATGWLKGHWLWILAAPVLFFAAAAIGLLDPVAIYLEKRHHELWIVTDTVAVNIWRANRIEVHKALRAIQRARERAREQNEV